MTAQRKTLLSVLCFLFLACIFFLSRDACLTPTAMIGNDASVFASIGWSWINGLVPYKDVFDHKGPIIYLLNALGFVLGGDFYGVVYIEILNMFLFAALFLYVDRENSLLYCIFFIFIYVLFISHSLEHGNYTEEYALLFNGLAACAWLKKSRHRFYLYGLCGALLFFLRVNLAALTFSIFLVDLWTSRGYIRNALKTSLGFLVPLGAIVWYFYQHDALRDFYASYILFNFGYTAGGGLKSILSAYYYFIASNRVFFLLCALFLIGIYVRQRKYFVSSLIFLLFPFLFSCISGRKYDHYVLMVTPSIFILFSVLLKDRHTDTALLTFLTRHLSQKERGLLKAGVFLIAATCVAITTFSWRALFDGRSLEALRAAYAEAGVRPDSKILNLGKHYHASVYYLTRTLPPEKDFFPATALSTEASRQLLERPSAICPGPGYDFLLLGLGQQLAPGCPYGPVATKFALGQLYRRTQ